MLARLNNIAASMIALALVVLGFWGGMQWEKGRHAIVESATVRSELKVANNLVDTAIKEGNVLSSFLVESNDKVAFFADARSQVEKYYANPKAQPKPVRSVPAPPVNSQKTTPTEVIYEDIPEPDCVADDDLMFDDDELRLFNLGNKRSDHIGYLSGKVPSDPSGREGRDEAGNSD